MTELLQNRPLAFAACVAGVVLALRLGWLIRPRRRHASPRSLRELGEREESGTAVLDFTLTLPLFVMIVLMVIQFVLLVRAQVVVSHATFLAARSAVVWIDQGVEAAERRAQAAASVGCLILMPSVSFGELVTRLDGPVDEGRAPSSLFAPLLALHGGETGLIEGSETLRRTRAAFFKHLQAKRWTEAEIVGLDSDADIRAETVVPVRVTHYFHLTVPYADGVLGRLIGERMHGRFVAPIRDVYTLQGQKRVLTEPEPGKKCVSLSSGVRVILKWVKSLF